MQAVVPPPQDIEAQQKIEAEKAEIKEQQQAELTEVPIIDFQVFFDATDKEAYQRECQKVAQSFHTFGICIVRDPRVNHEQNDEYIDMIENYFEEVSEKFYRGEELEDCRPELSYQTGVTPESIEKARNHEALVNSLTGDNKPMTAYPIENDAKWRFFWPIGERPENLNNEVPKVYPANFPDWEQKMDGWGNHMINAATTAAEMAAVGMGLEKETFSEKMKLGAHLLAPTASDLMKYDVGTAFASFHYDLNFITIHGKSRFPGLFLWKRDWTKMACKVPAGCLLLQAGIMFEWLTGGYVLAGFHEVVYTEDTKRVRDEKIRKTEESGEKQSTWRISSTLFSHIRHDVDLSPLPELDHLYDEEAKRKYYKCTAFEKLIEELKAINLAPKQSYAEVNSE